MKKTSDVLNPALNKVPEALSGAEDLLGLMQSIIAEYDAVHLYKALAESTRNSKVNQLMEHLIEEELKHIGELQEIMEELDETVKEHIEDGKKEFKERD